MDLARYLVDAVIPEGRSYREVAAAHGVSKSYVAKLGPHADLSARETYRAQMTNVKTRRPLRSSRTNIVGRP